MECDGRLSRARHAGKRWWRCASQRQFSRIGDENRDRERYQRGRYGRRRGGCDLSGRSVISAPAAAPGRRRRTGLKRPRPMRILYATPPGRFPTVAYDPGPWWDSIAADPRYKLSSYSINFDWWSVLVGDSFARLLLEPLSPLERQHRRAAWRANELDVDGRAAAAAATLKQFQSSSVYLSQPSYLETLAPLAAFFDVIDRVQSEFRINVDVGPQVRGIDFSGSRSLVPYSATSGLLSRTIDAAIARVPATYDAVLFSITGPEDLLTALMAARKLRTLRPAAHI